MKTYNKIICLFALAGALLSAQTVRATGLSFLVDINTAAIAGSNASGPFSLDFQLTHDSGLTNTATVSNFNFTGGTPTGSAVTTVGASGSLTSSVSLLDAEFLNELYQQFSADTTDIKFQVNLTTNTPGATPDGFSVSILDNNTFNIPTTALSGDTLLAASITNSLALSDLVTSTSTGSSTGGVTVSVAAIPEPGTAAALLGAAALAVVVLKRSRKKTA